MIVRYDTPGVIAFKSLVMDISGGKPHATRIFMQKTNTGALHVVALIFWNQAVVMDMNEVELSEFRGWAKVQEIPIFDSKRVQILLDNKSSGMIDL